MPTSQTAAMGGVANEESADLRCHLPPQQFRVKRYRLAFLPTAPYKFHPAASDADALTGNGGRFSCAGDHGRRTRLRIRSIHPLDARARCPHCPPSLPQPLSSCLSVRPSGPVSSGPLNQRCQPWFTGVETLYPSSGYKPFPGKKTLFTMLFHGTTCYSCDPLVTSLVASPMPIRNRLYH